MSGALDGVRVIDFAQGWAGPGASMYLADQGADVIKVEPPGGDMARGWYPSAVLHGTSRSFLAVNRNKRSIAVDLRRPEGREIAHALAREADVAILNMSEAAARRLGIDYEALAGVNARLVYGAVSGFGDRGPYAGLPAYDQVIQGLAGAMDRRLPDGTPLRSSVWVADTCTPMLLAYGVTLALLHRERTGRGQRVDTSLLQAAVALQVVDLVHLERDPQVPPIALTASTVYRCQDDAYLNVLALTERQLVGLCTVLGLERLLEREEFRDPARDLASIQRGWREEVAARFEQEPAATWLPQLRAAGVPCGPVLSREQALDEPQLQDSEALVSLDHPDAGRIKIAGVPVRLSDAPGGVRRLAPSLGEDTDEVLRTLGYSPAQVEALRERGVIGGGRTSEG